MINHPNMLTSLLTEAVRASWHRGLNHCYGMSLDMKSTPDCQHYLWVSQDAETDRDIWMMAALLDGHFYSELIS